MAVLNDLEMKGSMQELLGATSSWNPVELSDLSECDDMATSALPPGQFGLLVGAAGGVMCMDALTKLGLTPAV